MERGFGIKVRNISFKEFKVSNVDGCYLIICVWLECICEF